MVVKIVKSYFFRPTSAAWSDTDECKLFSKPNRSLAKCPRNAKKLLHKLQDRLLLATNYSFQIRTHKNTRKVFQFRQRVLKLFNPLVVKFATKTDTFTGPLSGPEFLKIISGIKHPALVKASAQFCTVFSSPVPPVPPVPLCHSVTVCGAKN